MADELIERLKRIAIERLPLEADPSDLLATENLSANYGVDSVRLFDLVVGLEEDFGVSFEDRELRLDRFATLGDIAQRLREKGV